MKTAGIFLSALTMLLLTACAPRQHSLPSTADGPGQVLTEADAIAVVQATIQSRGGDPSREECSAHRTEKGWSVTAWHIWYPEKQGSSRFVPGGFTIYLLANDGKIIQTIPGH